jgi:hypothetical protein
VVDLAGSGRDPGAVDAANAQFLDLEASRRGKVGQKALEGEQAVVDGTISVGPRPAWG